MQFKSEAVTPSENVVLICSVKINDDVRLSAYKIGDQSTLNLLMMSPFNIYVQGIDGKKHTIYTKSEASVFPKKCTPI